MNKIINYIDRSIEYLYYSLFILIPLVFAGNTSELFEFNKMWMTFGITTIILAFWFSKMVILKKVVFKRTILDIPILLFLISQIISTIISLDSYVSFWGYYSRWNGGLLSTITYIALYYAFVSNFFSNTEDEDSESKSFLDRNPAAKTIVKRSLFASIISGFIVSLWSIPSHFGYDPTCLIFRGSFDVSCWTADFQPKVRVFGPLGQPNWLAGYMGVLIPITLALVIDLVRKTKNYLNPYLIFYSISFVLFYLTLLYTGSRSGMAASIFTLALFVISYILLNIKDLSFIKDKFLIGLVFVIILVSFFAGIRLPVAEKFSFNSIKGVVTSDEAQNSATEASQSDNGAPAVSSLSSGISGSGEIRNIVWRGAIDVWKANPVFGTGVETFAFAYYKYRPPEHNRLSEWNFLYNKAHNEYLNYLATTGSFGFLSYMFFITLFILIVILNLANKKIKEIKYLGNFSAPFKVDNKDPLILSLLFSFLSILIINFFGFSVVILNIYLFMIPVFAILLLGLINQDQIYNSKKIIYISYAQWSAVTGIFVLAFFIIYILFRYWIADTSYALGKNYDGAQAYEQAYPLLQKAVDGRGEPVFEDEFAVNKAILALALSQQENSSQSAEVIQSLANEAVTTSEKLVTEHPNNIVFSKSRVRILYTLAQVDPRYFPLALEAIKATNQLAPTDASILYNLGVLYGQNGDSESAIKALERTIEYKPDYTDARYALALFYHDLGVDANTGKIINEDYRNKGIEQLKIILERLNPDHQLAKDSLSAWENEK